MLTSIIALCLLIIFLFLENKLRFGSVAKEFNAKSDKSSFILGFCYGLNMILLFINIIFMIFHNKNNAAMGVLGIVFMLIGFFLRILANLQLGKYYTKSLVVTEDQKVISTGLYHFIRHPGYLGSIITWIGAGLASQNDFILLVILIITIAAYWYRIIKEEDKLLMEMGDSYKIYMEKTKRIIPFIF
ncbi:MAG: isoprenylcysteine carboxylmethyltransferase family protein [Oscillospiraceae bacterium]|nr:isoprenylcysteine carboxylmethyltransferase family protein [Oscillospiraceae bacterium]